MIPEKKAQADFKLMPEIADRWSPRAFADKPVENKKLLRVLEAARWAPSSRNEQPWRFIIAQKGDAHYDRLFEGLDEGNRKWAWTAPVIAATLGKRKFDYKDRENHFHMHDLGLAMGNLLAQATHEGLYVHQMAGIIPENIISNFNINESEYGVSAMFVMGYQDEARLDELDEKYSQSERRTRQRKSLKEIVFGARFGESPDWLNI